MGYPSGPSPPRLLFSGWISCLGGRKDGMGTWRLNGNAPERISLYPDQLASLMSLARVLPARKYLVLLALLRYLQADSLKSTATREQIEELTGVRKRTIYTYLQEFEECGLHQAMERPIRRQTEVLPDKPSGAGRGL